MKKNIVFALLALTATVVFAKPITVGLVTDVGGIDDKSFNQGTWEGVKAYAQERGLKIGQDVKYLQSTADADYIPNLSTFADQKMDLIVAPGFLFNEAMLTVAQQYPNQKFMIIDSVVQDKNGKNVPNVANAVFAANEGSFLAGVAAGLKAKADGVKNPKFGFIGGIPGPVITKFEVGYVMGILSILPNSKIVDYYANDWGKPELAKAQAKNWFDSGVYAIFSAAGGTGNGTIAQAKEYRAQGKNVWAIGVDSDQYEDGIYSGTKSAVLTSMIKRVETASLTALNEVKNGTFKARVLVLDTKANGVAFATSNPELGKSIIAQVEKIRSEIIAGKIKVYATYAEAKAAGKVPGDLQASDK